MDPGSYFDEFTERDWQTAEPGEPVRIAAVGLGWFTRNWALPGMVRGEFCEPAVVVDTDESVVDGVAGEYGVRGLTAEQFRDGEALEAYDAVYVCTPNATHLPYVEFSAEHGKDVLCEKPMEVSSERAAEMVEACEEAGVTLMVGYRMQTEPAVRRTKDLLEAGFIGEPVHVHGGMSQTMLAELSPTADQWRLDPELSGGCAMMDMGIYPLNTTRFLLESDPTEVYARTVTEHEPFEGIDEHVSYHLTFPGNVDAVCTISQQSHHSSHLRITGTEGEITLDPAFFEREDRGMQVSRDGVTADLEFDQAHQLEEEFDYFGHCLTAGIEPVPDGEHGLRDMEVVEAVYESAETGHPVSLE